MVDHCRVVYSHGMLRLSTQGLMHLGTVGMFGCVGGSSTATWCNTELTGMSMYSVGGRTMWQLWLENWFGLVLVGRVETGTCLSLVTRVHATPLGGMTGVCKVVIGCAQPNKVRICNTYPNGYRFTEWRWLLLEWSCLPLLRSQWPIGCQSLWLKTGTFY